MLLSSLFFAVMQILINVTGSSIPLMEQVFFRNIVSLILSFIIIKRHKLSMFGQRKYQPLLFMRSLFGLLGLASLFYAAAHANQADVTILSKLSPFLITLWAFLFLKERITHAHILALFIAFGGAAMIANPSMKADLLPLLLAFLCAVCSSVSHTLLAYFTDRVDGITIVMHFSAFCVAASIPFMIMNFALPNVTELILLLLLGTFGCFGQFTLTYAYRMAPASEISVYNYSGIVFSMALGYLLLGETISTASLVGGAMVVGASLLAYRSSSDFSQYGVGNQ